MTHVDDYLDSPDANPIAKEFLEHARRSALAQDKAWLREHRPVVTWRGKQYRCVGASRLGDVWLKDETKNDRPDAYYDHRVDVDELSDWRKP